MDRGQNSAQEAHAGIDNGHANVTPSVKASFNHHIGYPEVHGTASVHPPASVIEIIFLDRRVMGFPCASIRKDEGIPFYMGDFSNVRDCCEVHALESAVVGADVQALVFKSPIGSGCVNEPGAKVVGEKVQGGRYVPMGAVAR